MLDFDFKFDSSVESIEKYIKLGIGGIVRVLGKEVFNGQYIRFTYNSRLNRAVARCCYGSKYNTIEFSDYAFEYLKAHRIDLVIALVIHEVLHSICGSACGHRGLWKRYAEIISAKTDFKISTYTNEEEDKIIYNCGKKYKYELRCTKCGEVRSHYARKCWWFGNESIFTCHNCSTKGTLKIIQNY